MMIGTQTAIRRRSIALIAALIALAVVVLAALVGAAERPATANAASASEACPDAGLPAAESTTNALKQAVRCRINEERTSRGIARVATDSRLGKASQRHVKAMVKTRCLAHRCPGEDDLEMRLRRAGYLDGAQSWRYAEDTGCGLSADAMVASWMATQFHRINLLEPRYKDLGIGVSQRRVKGRCKKGYATFAVVFGSRTP